MLALRFALNQGFRQVSTSAIRRGGGPRHYQVSNPQTHDYFWWRKIRMVIFGTLTATLVVFEGTSMLLGDAVYCEYDPKLYAEG